MAGAIAEKTFNSGLPDLLTQLLGSKQVTSSPGSTQTTQSQTTANTAPLEQAIGVAGQQMTPEMLQQLISGIFGTAAQQVPQLTASLANAVGTRSGTNSPLALAVTDQNNLAMKQALQQMLQYNQQASQTAVQGAASLANATKQTTETTSKAPSEQTVTTGSGGNPMQLALMGFLANQADKRGLFDKLGNSLFGGSEATQLTTPSLQLPTFDFTAPAGPDANFTGANTIFQAQPVFDTPAMTFDAGTGTALPDFGIGDFFGGGSGGGIGDLFSGASDAFSSVGNSVASGFDPIWDVSDMGFFADGGTVRNRNNMGAPQQRTGMASINSAPASATSMPTARRSSGASSSGLSTDVLTTFLARAAEEDQMRGDVAASTITPQGEKAITADAANGYSDRNRTLALAASLLAGMMAPAMGLAAGPRTALSLSGVTTGPVGAGVKLVKQLVDQTRAESSTQAINELAPSGFNVATNPTTGGQYSEMPAVDVLGNVGPANMSLDPAVTGLDLSNAALGYTPTSDGSGYTGNTSGGSYGSLGSDSYSSTADTYGLADGGMLSGPGTGTSDSIPAKSKTPGSGQVRLSDGEFIIPADVAARPGMKEHFQMLINAYHTPVRR